MLKKKLLSNEGGSRQRSVYYMYKMFNFVLPIGSLLLIHFGLTPLAVLIVLFSKWRVLAVKPRHIMANLRSNSVDIIVKLSTLAFMIEAATLTEQIIWTIWYIVWLTMIKPASTRSWMKAQAAAAHFLGVSAILLLSNSLNHSLILLVIWLVALSSARHLISSYEEPRTQIMAHIWALFALQISWVMSKWLLVYVFVPQLIFILGVVGYALVSVYDAHKREELKMAFMRQQAIMTTVILILIILLADWQGNT